MEETTPTPKKESRITKIGEKKSSHREVFCASCKGPAKKKKVKLKAVSTRPYYTLYRCPNCKGVVKLPRPMSDVLVVKLDPKKGRGVKDDSEDARK